MTKIFKSERFNELKKNLLVSSSNFLYSIMNCTLVYIKFISYRLQNQVLYNCIAQILYTSNYQFTNFTESLSLFMYISNKSSQDHTGIVKL